MNGYNLIILPGWGGSHDTWRDFVKVAEKYFDQVKVIDLPCFGDCPCPQTVWGVEDYAQYAYSEISKLNFTNTVLMGHSFGGQVSVKFASEHPEMIKKMILSGPAVFRPSFSVRRFFFGLLAKFGKKIFSLPFLEKAGVFARKFLYHKIIKSRDYVDSAGIKKEIFKKIIRQDLSGILPKIEIPTLILWGEKDAFVPLKNGKKMLQMMPKSSLHIVKKAGHGLHINNREEMILTIQHFLHDERY